MGPEKIERLVAQPELVEEAEEQRRMKHLRPRLTDAVPHARQDVVVKGAEPGLLLAARLGLRAPRLVACGELLRREEVEQINVARREPRIPVVDAAARHRDHTRGIDPVCVLEPAKERDPVERLVADLREPRPRDDRRTSPRNRRDLPLDGHFLPPVVELLPEARGAPGDAHERLVHPERAPHRLQPDVAGRGGGISG